MPDDYRQRIASALITRISQAPIVVQSSLANAAGPGAVTEYDLANAVLAVPNPEMEQLRETTADLKDLIVRERAIHIETIRRAESDEAGIARARLLHPSPAELVAGNAQSDTLCPTCIYPAPCPTRRALDGQE